MSNQQKLIALKSAIDPSITYSFAIGCMKVTDIKQFDTIRTSVCKKLHGLHVSTSTAMTHEDPDKAGLGLPSLEVNHRHEICKSMLQALNDKGVLGIVTWNLLLLQNAAIGVTLRKQVDNKLLRRITHYHLARQLATLKDSDLELKLPLNHPELTTTALSETLSSVMYKPEDLGLECSIPAEIYIPLLELTDNISGLCLLKNKRHLIINTDELKRRFGNRVRKEHRVALNQLTKILSSKHSNKFDLSGPTFMKVRPLNEIDRVIRDPEILEELSNCCTAHLRSVEINEAENEALVLLQSHHKMLQQQYTQRVTHNEQTNTRKRASQTVRSSDGLQNSNSATCRPVLKSRETQGQPLRRSARLNQAQEDAAFMGLGTDSPSETTRNSLHATKPDSVSGRHSTGAVRTTLKG